MGTPFDLEALSERLKRVFPGLVEARGEHGDIMVVGRIRVTENGVVEGSGPVADRVKTIFEEYVRDQSLEQASNPGMPRQEGKVRNPFRCQHCGLRLTGGRVYRRTIEGSVMLFCCKRCADHEEAEAVKLGSK